MSTRCQIKIKGSQDNIHLYKHCDGYPEEVIPTLAPMVKDFVDKRGYDPDYLLCQIVRAFAQKDVESGYYSKYTGWGLDCCQHGDINYLYEVCPKTGDVTTKKMWA